MIHYVKIFYSRFSTFLTYFVELLQQRIPDVYLLIDILKDGGIR